MRLLERCGPAYLQVPGGEPVTLKDTDLSDAEGITRCVAANATVLDVCFPGQTERYRTQRSTRKAIQSLSRAPDVAALTIGRRNPEGEESIIGRATVILGSVACEREVIIEDGINVALWLDEQHWHRGIGRTVLKSLVNHARQMFDQGQVFTLVDADNDRSHNMVRAVGFTADEEARDYEFKGAIYTDSVFYIFS